MVAPTFRSEDEEAQSCLSALRDGTRNEKIVARDRLATIFARRGLFEEAADLYERNLRAGVRAPELFERLSDVYHHLGDRESAEAALSEARRMRAASASVGPPLNGASQSAGPGTAVVLGGLPEPGPARGSTMLASEPTPGELPTVTLGDAAAGTPSRKRIPRIISVFGVIVFAIVVPIALLALLVVNPLGLYLEGRGAGPTLDVRAGQAVQLKIAPGMASTWYLQTGRSVSGLWATPGLDLTLDADLAGAVREFTVTAPRGQSWGETITVVERRGQGRTNQETVVPATFEAPAALPPAGTVLSGRIAGPITAPRLAENSQFNTTTERVDLPVKLVVVADYELWIGRFADAVSMLFDEDRWLLVTIGSLLTWCLLAGVAALLFRSRPA